MCLSVGFLLDGPDAYQLSLIIRHRSAENLLTRRKRRASARGFAEDHPRMLAQSRFRRAPARARRSPHYRSLGGRGRYSTRLVLGGGGGQTDIGGVPCCILIVIN